MEGPRPPPIPNFVRRPSTATANGIFEDRAGRVGGARGLRAAAAELTKAPNGRKAQEASGRASPRSRRTRPGVRH